MAGGVVTGQGTAPDRIRWVANLHTVFPGIPLLERPSAARAAGFTEVEYWWPFDGQPVPSRSDVEALVEAVSSAGVQLTAMNLYAGTMASGDRGVLSHPEHARDFRASVDVAMEIGARLGTRLFNVPYGHRLSGVSVEAQETAAAEGLEYAARAAEALDGCILVEPLSGFPDYPIRSSRAAVEVIDRVLPRVAPSSIGLLLDQYHLAANGEDPLADLDFVLPYLRHVQVADVPGRGAPGSGDGDVRGFVEALLATGYEAAIALEYVPDGSIEESLETWRRTFDVQT